jgi:phosphoglycolate phosphatase
MSGFQLIIFDYDGTLFDTRRAVAHCLQRTFEASAKPPPSDARVSAAVNRGLVLQDTLVFLDGNLAREPTALDGMVDTYRHMYLQQASSMLQPFPEVAATLRQLQAAGHKCVIVSNKGAMAIRQSLEHYGLDSHIDCVFGQAAGLPKKPDPAVLTEYVLPHYDNVPMDQILGVGDTEVDILFAKCTGIRSCWASYGYGDAARCQNLKPDHEIARFGALLGIVAP